MNSYFDSSCATKNAFTTIFVLGIKKVKLILSL